MCACWGGFFIVKVTAGRWPSHLECVCVVERDREQLEGEREKMLLVLFFLWLGPEKLLVFKSTWIVV